MGENLLGTERWRPIRMADLSAMPMCEKQVLSLADACKNMIMNSKASKLELA